jgi:hypothetical protein
MAELDLVRVPTDDDLARMYFELGERGASATGARADWLYAPASDEELVVLAAQMARHDARLLGVLVELLLRRWQQLSPVALRAALRRTRTPQALCVAIEFARGAEGDPELTLWARHVCHGFARHEPPAHFFVDDVRPGTRLAERRKGRSLAPYSRWGFIGVERPTIDPFRKRSVGRYDTATRRRILQGMTASGAVTLSEYLDALGGSISRQQARADFRAAGLVPSGPGRGASWRPRARRGGKRKRSVG